MPTAPETFSSRFKYTFHFNNWVGLAETEAGCARFQRQTPSTDSATEQIEPITDLG
jgi:hypothetical protein